MKAIELEWKKGPLLELHDSFVFFLIKKVLNTVSELDNTQAARVVDGRKHAGVACQRPGFNSCLTLLYSTPPAIYLQAVLHVAQYTGNFFHTRLKLFFMQGCLKKDCKDCMDRSG